MCSSYGIETADSKKKNPLIQPGGRRIYQTQRPPFTDTKNVGLYDNLWSIERLVRGYDGRPSRGEGRSHLGRV